MSDTEKFVILGEGRVGKTSILCKYFTNKFNEGEKQTINPSYYEKQQNFNGKNYKLTFWDTAGQEQFNAINTMYYNGAKGALLVYDVTIPETFEKVKTWILTLKEAVGKDIIFVIAGNKFDLSNKNSLIKNEEQINEYIKQENCKHFYTSAKTGYNLEEVFGELIKTTLSKISNDSSKNKNRGRKLQITQESQSQTKENKKGCC